MSEKFLVAGATGAIGRRIVHYAAQDPRVATVTALVRGAEKSPEFYGLEPGSDSAMKVTHLKVDYATVKDTELPAHTVGASGLGVYTHGVSSQEDFFNKEHAPNMDVATAAAKAGVTKWAYLSGMGVYPNPGEKPWHQAMFSFVKGRVEHDLSNKVEGLKEVFSARPGGIFGRPNADRLPERLMNAPPLKWLQHTPLGVHTDDIAKAMVQSVIGGTEGVNDLPKPIGRLQVFENQDLKTMAAKYDNDGKTSE